MTIGQKNKNKEFIKLLARRGELDLQSKML